MRVKRHFILVIVLLFLVSCGPSDQAIEQALAQTQTAQATNTNTPEPTLTFTLEPTFTPTFTQTPIPTFTQTLTPTPDTRVITLGPEVFLLTADEYRNYPVLTKNRLYLETMESGLGGVNKFIMDKNNKGRNALTILGTKDINTILNNLTELTKPQSRGSMKGGGSK